MAAPLLQLPKPKQTPKRRSRHNQSQQVRRAVQYVFFGLNLWIGIEFYGFVRYCESGGMSCRFSRPPGVEGWLPIASLMNLRLVLLTGRLPQTICAGMFLLCVFLATSFLLRKSFCGWLCPVGTFSEWLWKLGRRLVGRNIALARWIDLPLRGLKYLLMGFFLFAVGTMSAGAIEGFLVGPNGVVADVQLLNFFRHLSGTAGAVLIVLVALSMFIQNFWCRYLCPYGALMGITALLSPVRIERTDETCIECAKCRHACPAHLPVDRLVTIRSAECMACMECVAVCPSEGALELKLARRWPVSPMTVAAVIAILFFGTVLVARASGHWTRVMDERTYMELVEHADEAVHP